MNPDQWYSEWSSLAEREGDISMPLNRYGVLKCHASQMKPIPLSGSRPDDDLNEKLERHVQQALTEEDAVLYAFGEPWGPESQADRYFGFQPGQGIHDIHMNQGNSGTFVAQDGV